MNIGIIIQARTGSTRMPGKVVKPFYNDASILEIIIQRILTHFSPTDVVLATTTNTLDDAVEELGQRMGVNTFRGSENNVLSRFTDVITKYQYDGVIRVCADNPFLDVASFDTFIDWAKESESDYTAYGVSDNTPTIKTHFGLWAEYVSGKALLKAAKLTDEKLYLEHVTNFIYGNPHLFTVDIYKLPQQWLNEKSIRFTLDSEEDFNLLQEVYSECMKTNASLEPGSLLAYVKAKPQIEREMARQVKRWEK